MLALLTEAPCRGGWLAGKPLGLLGLACLSVMTAAAVMHTHPDVRLILICLLFSLLLSASFGGGFGGSQQPSSSKVPLSSTGIPIDLLPMATFYTCGRAISLVATVRTGSGPGGGGGGGRSGFSFGHSGGGSKSSRGFEQRTFSLDTGARVPRLGSASYRELPSGALTAGTIDHLGICVDSVHNCLWLHNYPHVERYRNTGDRVGLRRCPPLAVGEDETVSLDDVLQLLLDFVQAIGLDAEGPLLAESDLCPLADVIEWAASSGKVGARVPGLWPAVSLRLLPSVVSVCVYEVLLSKGGEGRGMSACV